MLRPDQYHGAATQASAGDLSTDDPLCKGGAVDDPVDRLGATSVPSRDVAEHYAVHAIEALLVLLVLES